MRTEIAKWGNSLAVRLPKSIVDRLALRDGSAVEIVEADGTLVIRPSAPRYALDDLLAGITSDNQPDETFDDRPRGAEIL